MAYTTINKSSDYFNTKLYTGNFTDNTDITGVGFQPDLVWLKERSSGSSNLLQDAVRGANKDLFSDTSSAEESNTNRMKAFISDGFTLGAHNLSNQNGETYASWNWKANGAGSANTAGSINSTVSANTTSGFSIVSFVGNATSGATVGHGLNAVPKVVIIKGRDSALEWRSYFSPIGAGKYMVLNENYAQATGSNFMNDTAPTSSVFSLGNGTTPNKNGENYIAYCFSDVQGFSKIGSYIGNGSADGPFVYTGFKPAFCIFKRIDGANNWELYDSKRLGYNSSNPPLYPNTNDVEGSNGRVDILSNGFKFKTGSSHINGSGGNFIYMAFAEAPLVGTNNVPCTAR